MTDNRNNTLSTILHEIFRRDKNLLEFLELQQTLLTSEDETVEIVLTKSDGSTERHNVSSIGSLIQRINNLEGNVKSLSNIDNLSSAVIRLGDGSTRTIILNEQFKEPNPFVIGDISAYSSKNNPLEHLFVTPFLFIKIPISRDIYPSYDKCLINKITLTLDTEDKLSIFESSIKNKQLGYDELIVILESNDIEKSESNIEKQISASNFRNIGTFDILSIKQKKDIISGTSSDNIEIVYKLNTLFYKNVETNTDIYLKVGDPVMIGDNTKYEITFLDKSTNFISLKLISGYEPVTTGVSVVKFFGDIDDPYIEAPINRNEYLAFFVKPINSNLSVVSNDWGIGYSINTEDLISEINTYNLWESISSIANEKLIPANKFIKPNKPSILASDIKIVNVNKHKAGKDTLDNLKNRFSKKKLVESNLKMVQDNIAKTEKQINITPSDDNFSKNKLSKELTSLKEKMGNFTKELSSSVNELNAIATDFKDYKPKYQIHGFIKKSDDVLVNGSVQKVIGYETEYRYLNKDETKDENNSFDIEQDGITKKSIIPKWLKMPNPKIREKDANGNWLEESESDVDKFNINQITIPISSNEKVEIRTRAISEVGYPLNINYSDYSDPIVVEFPEEVLDDTVSLLEQSKSDIIYNRIFESLAEKGLDIHNADSSTIGEFYYAHFLKNLGTDELTPENKPIDAQTIINSMKDRINQLETTLSGAGGSIRVRLLDEEEKSLSDITNNSTIKLLEYYKNLIDSNTVKKGSIVDKTFYIEITNIGIGNIELFPYVTGTKDDKLIANYAGYSYNINEYNQYRQPYLAPMVRLNTINDNDFLSSKQLSEPFVELPSFQSSQVKGQILMSRAKDITLNNDLWIDDQNGYVLPIFGGSTVQSFIWDGSQTLTNPNGGGGYTDFCVHTDHPALQLTSDFMSNFNNYYQSGAFQTLPMNTATISKVYYPEFVQSLYSSNENTVSQLSYYIYSTNSFGSATLSNFPRKAKFMENDKYLIGRNTCGLYVNLAMNDDSIFSDTKFSNEGVIINSNKRLLIPISVSGRLTDYYGIGSTGIGNIGGVPNVTNIKYTKKIGIDILVKENKLELQKLLSFDFSYTMQYQKSSVN